jgi:hypothetical protein
MDGREEAPASFNESAFCTDDSCTSAINFFPERVTGGVCSSQHRTCRLAVT